MAGRMTGGGCGVPDDPPGARMFRLVATANIVLTAGALVVGWTVWRRPDKFFREGVLDLGLSAVLLVGTAVLCWRVFRTREATPGATGAGLWRLVSAGFLYLALDEVFEFHERLDEGLHALVDVAETALSDRLDDLIVLGYGIAGAAVLWRFRAEVAHFRPLAGFLRAAAVAFVLMAAIDLATSRHDLVLRVVPPPGGWDVWRFFRGIEESLKLVAEGTLLGTAYAALLRARALAGSAVVVADERSVHAAVARAADPDGVPPSAARSGLH
jgi:hypothetical protein